MTLQPAYGNDYKSKVDVIEAINNYKDFILTDLGQYARWNGKPLNIEDMATGSVYKVRYKDLTRSMFVRINKDRKAVVYWEGGK